ncbi:tripartite tricarboxylate transporter TctB family protein [Robertmurraya massiliosenegalensis]|uniref:tripartite tricarboxylate transporter TctB family protein n=1 Tax=Robertmurraya TaxID=2837507 RepID=UPI0039A71E7F
MSYKKATYISLLCIILFAFIYGYMINTMNIGVQNSSIGPRYFPNLITILLVVLCIISFFQTLRNNENKKFTVNNLKYIFAMIGITAIFFALWYFLDLFYLGSFLFLTSLYILFLKDRSFKRIIKSAVVACVFTIFIYFVFGKLMFIGF